MMPYAYRLRAWAWRKRLDLGLWALFIGSAFFMLKSSSDRLPPSLRGMEVVEALLSQFSTGNQIVFDITAGIIGSLVLYVLVVRVPERAKRHRVRRNLQRQYESFKEESIKVFLWALQGSYDVELVERLKHRDRFRRFFDERVSPSQNRWHAVLNGLDEGQIETLAVELEILMSEVHFTLTAVDVDNPDVFAFLKRLAQVLYRAKHTWSPDSDDVKQLAQFMWSIHTGWSFSEGYTEKDIMAEMIAAI